MEKRCIGVLLLGITLVLLLGRGGRMVQLAGSLGPQQSPPATKQTSQLDSAGKGDRQEGDREEDRARAFSLLEGIVREAIGWNDATSVKVLAHIARVTWSSDPDYSRRQLRRAADILIRMIDQEKYPSPQEEKSLLQGVLAVAAQTDPRLVGELSEKLQNALSRRKVKASRSSSGLSRYHGSASIPAQEVMAYAASVATEQPELAAQLAETSLRSGISGELPTVVWRLHQSRPDLAARVLMAAVNALERSHEATVEDVYLVQAWISNEEIGQRLSRDVLARYFDAASRILERTLNSPTLSTASALDAYFAATQLLPLYDRYAPERSGFVRSRLAEIRRLPEVEREEERERQVVNRPRGPGAAEVRLARARSALTDIEHDTKLIALASDLRQLGHLERALEILAEVRDTRKRVQFQDLFLLLTIRDLKRKDLDQALTWARRIQTPTWRARALIEIAQEKVNRHNREAAAASLDEARHLLLTEAKTPERALVWLFAAMVYAALDPQQGFATLNEATVAANAIRNLQLELPGERVIIEDEGFSTHFILPFPFALDLDQGFKVLAAADFERALLAAQSFAAKEIRARAIIAVAATLLQGGSSGS